MAHFLMYSDLFDTEGIVSSPSYGAGNKGEILRMIGLYEQDLPRLKGARAWAGFARPSALHNEAGAKGGRPRSAATRLPPRGSDWIVSCAPPRRPRPLYVLVWGGLDDVAQALHDAPDIAPRIRVYWIGGPNKKWSLNSYVYIVENFPGLWGS